MTLLATAMASRLPTVALAPFAPHPLCPAGAGHAQGRRSFEGRKSRIRGFAGILDAHAAKRNTSGVFSTPRSPLHDPSTPMRKRPPWRRALGRFLPLIMMAVAVKTRSEVVAIVNVVMAFTYLWLEEVRDKKERE